MFYSPNVIDRPVLNVVFSIYVTLNVVCILIQLYPPVLKCNLFRTNITYYHCKVLNNVVILYLYFFIANINNVFSAYCNFGISLLSAYVFKMSSSSVLNVALCCFKCRLLLFKMSSSVFSIIYFGSSMRGIGDEVPWSYCGKYIFYKILSPGNP